MKKIISLFIASILVLMTSVAVFAEGNVLVLQDFENEIEKGGNMSYGLEGQSTEATATSADLKDYWLGGRRDPSDLESVVEIVEGKGYLGSNAVAITTNLDSPSSIHDQLDFMVFFDEAQDLSDMEYMMVWFDFTNHDFYFSSLALILEDGTYGGTDERDGVYDKFYYLADGSTEWEEYSLSYDNGFGMNEGIPLNGMKGFFAFDLDNFAARTSVWATQQSGRTGDLERTEVRGATFTFDPDDDNYPVVGVPMYIDSWVFTDELSVENIPAIDADDDQGTTDDGADTGVDTGDDAAQTFDFGVIALVAAVVSAAAMLLKKKR